MRGSFGERVRVLEEIADDQEADPQDRIRALDVLGKYGIGTIREVSVDEVRERLRATLTVLRAELTDAQATAVIQRLKEVWSA